MGYLCKAAQKVIQSQDNRMDNILLNNKLDGHQNYIRFINCCIPHKYFNDYGNKDPKSITDVFSFYISWKISNKWVAYPVECRGQYHV